MYNVRFVRQKLKLYEETFFTLAEAKIARDAIFYVLNPHLVKKVIKSHNPAYGNYVAMKARCINKKARVYKYYGGKGIKVCDRWLESFDNFLEDMGPRPSKKHSIDRIDNDKGYFKENCRWAPPAVQTQNRRIAKECYQKHPWTTESTMWIVSKGIKKKRCKICYDARMNGKK